MPVGTKYCCGVIEIFPSSLAQPMGEGGSLGGGSSPGLIAASPGPSAIQSFKHTRGHGNMARRMGHR